MLLKRILYPFTGGLKSYFITTLSILGGIWTVIECISFFSVDIKNLLEGSLITFFIAVTLSLVIGFYLILPKTRISRCFPSSDTNIVIKVGNLFNENNHIVIPTSDYFDTVNVSSKRSIKSQMVSDIYHGGTDQVNELINVSLREQNIIGQLDAKKPDGKQFKYNPGTIAILPASKYGKILLAVFSTVRYSDAGRRTETDATIINDALNSLWDKYRHIGQQGDLSIPVFGAGLSAAGFSYQLLIQKIVLSFALYSRKNKLTNKLNIIINTENYKPELFDSLQLFLNSIEI